MAVYVCAADESADSQNFFYGGFSAPVEVWEGCFANAWNERVLNGPPALPWLHMTDIRDWNWLEGYGLKPWLGDHRLDAAAEVIRSTGGLIPVVIWANKESYVKIVRRPFVSDPNMKKPQLEPDYLCFLGFALAQLKWLHGEYGHDVEKVHFWVEQNGRITHHLRGFHRSLVSALEYIGYENLIPLVGDFVPVEKACIPAQAADVLTWHARNCQRGRLDRWGAARHAKMIVGGRLTRTRVGRLQEMDEKSMRDLSELFAKYPSALERVPYDTSESHEAI